MGECGWSRFCVLGWQQLLGLEPFPKVAGAMGQLVNDLNPPRPPPRSPNTI